VQCVVRSSVLVWAVGMTSAAGVVGIIIVAVLALHANYEICRTHREGHVVRHQNTGAIGEKSRDQLFKYMLANHRVNRTKLFYKITGKNIPRKKLI
jgi:hypothetical protein